MKQRRFAITAGLGCAILTLLMIVVIPATFLFPLKKKGAAGRVRTSPFSFLNPFLFNGFAGASQPPPEALASTPVIQPDNPRSPAHEWVELYERIKPGVVNIQGFGYASSPSETKSGSGMVLKTEGYILTSSRLVSGASYLTATFYEGSEAEAKLIGQDPVSDIAILKVERLPDAVRPILLADSDEVKVGEPVFVLSNPSGLSVRMNSGIISGIGLSVAGGEAEPTIPEILEIDRIIPGEKMGGPLVNSQGLAVGITTPIPFEAAPPISETGHAVPSNLINKIAAGLIEKGSYSWPWLGVEGISVNIPILKANQLESTQGAYIDKIIPGSPAEAAGLQASTGNKNVLGAQVPVGGDVVVSADGTPVESFDDLLSLVSRKNPGEKMDLTIIRNGKPQALSIQLGKMPEY